MLEQKIKNLIIAGAIAVTGFLGPYGCGSRVALNIGIPGLGGVSFGLPSRTTKGHIYRPKVTKKQLKKAGYGYKKELEKLLYGSSSVLESCSEECSEISTGSDGYDIVCYRNVCTNSG